MEELEQLNIPENSNIAKGVNLKKKRIWEIDLIRGICVLLMIFDHCMYDVGSFGRLWKNLGMATAGSDYWTGDLRKVYVRPVIVFLFFFIAGISSSFSKSNFTRALQTIAFAYVISVASYIMGPTIIDIEFGVLHALGFSMLIYAILDSFDKSIYSKLATGLTIVTMGFLMGFGAYLETSLSLIIIGVTLIVFGSITEKKVLSKYSITGLSLIAAGVLILILKSLIENTVSLKIPPGNFQWLNNVIGYPKRNYDDYFALIPWAGIFLLGSVFAKLFYEKRKSLLPKLDTKFTKPVEYIGRHALIIYVAHQVIIYGAFVVIGLICGYNLPF